MARRTSYVIRGKRLAAFSLIIGFVFTGLIASNLGENGTVILDDEKLNNVLYLMKNINY